MRSLDLFFFFFVFLSKRIACAVRSLNHRSVICLFVSFFSSIMMSMDVVSQWFSAPGDLTSKEKPSPILDGLFFLALFCYGFSPSWIASDIEWSSGPLPFPPIVFQFLNLLLWGVIERFLFLKSLSIIDEMGWTESLRFRPLPGDKEDRAKDLDPLLDLPTPLRQNQNGVIMLVLFLLPWDFVVGGGVFETTTFDFSAKVVCRSLIVGLLVIDFILGSAHMASHTKQFKKWLWKYHAPHHTRHVNFPAVKFIGNAFDLEVFLTQVCYVFLPRLLGLDVLSGIILIDLFSLQLLVEHTGYNVFYVAQLHEAHHRFGNVGFYHYPIWEYLLGKLPSASQISKLYL